MLEISFRYRVLFTISILHNFFAENKSNTLRIVPTDFTLEKARRLGLILKPTENEIRLLYDEEKLDSFYNALNSQDTMEFLFYIYSDSPYFINYTALPIENKGQILYFTNTQRTHSDEQKIFLHTEQEVASGYYLPVSADKKLPEGLVQVQQEGSTAQEQINIPGAPVLLPVGFVRIAFDGDLKEELLRAIALQQYPEYHYQIQFGTRYTRWQYIVVPRYHKAVESLSIASEDQDVHFSGPQEVQTSDGRRAYLFHTDALLPLREKSSLKFQLVSGHDSYGNTLTVIDHLPVASVDRIRPESRAHDSKVFSEIIVYV
jgi:hypothetical protein